MDAIAKPTCRLVRPNDTYEGKQGFSYFAGVAAQTVGSKALCMHVLNIPPGGRAKAHMHESHETAVYLVSGEAEVWFGDRLENHVVQKAGEIMYIPAGVPHLPANLTDQPCVAIIARTDPNEQESVVLLPDLDALVPAAR